MEAEEEDASHGVVVVPDSGDARREPGFAEPKCEGGSALSPGGGESASRPGSEPELGESPKVGEEINGGSFRVREAVEGASSPGQQLGMELDLHRPSRREMMESRFLGRDVGIFLLWMIISLSLWRRCQSARNWTVYRRGHRLLKAQMMVEMHSAEKKHEQRLQTQRLPSWTKVMRSHNLLKAQLMMVM